MCFYEKFFLDLAKSSSSQNSNTKTCVSNLMHFKKKCSEKNVKGQNRGLNEHIVYLIFKIDK